MQVSSSRSPVSWSPEKFPSSWNEFSKENFPSLHSHFANLGEKQKKPDFTAKKYCMLVPLEELAKVVKELSEAILSKVKASIPQNYKDKVLLLIGDSRSGMSTTYCCLRGDKLKVKNYDYVSPESEKALISSKLYTSHTLFPSIHILKDLAIVDLPGLFRWNFDPALDLGIWSAIKSLIEIYRPRVLLHQPIDAKLDFTERVAECLDLLFEDKSKCLLGLSRYTRNPHYIAIEQEKANERLSTQKNSGEAFLKGMIEQLDALLQSSSLDDKTKDALRSKKAETTKKLRALETQRLSDVPKITKREKTHRRELDIIEDRALKHSGLTRSISLYKLEDPKQRDEILDQIIKSERLSPRKSGAWRVKNDSKFLKLYISEEILPRIRSGEFDKQCLAKLQDLTSDSSGKLKQFFCFMLPDLSDFFHLAELDPKVFKVIGEQVLEEIKVIFQRIEIMELLYKT